jgi:hypothetical protein
MLGHRAFDDEIHVCLLLQVGITLGLILPPKPSHPSLQMEVDFTEYLAAADVGYAVVLYLWLMVRLLQCVRLVVITMQRLTVRCADGVELHAALGSS